MSDSSYFPLRPIKGHTFLANGFPRVGCRAAAPTRAQNILPRDIHIRSYYLAADTAKENLAIGQNLTHLLPSPIYCILRQSDKY